MSDAYLTAFRAYIDEIMKATGLKRSAIAKRAALAPSTINRPYSQLNYGSHPKGDTIDALWKSFGIKPPPELSPGFSPKSPAGGLAEDDSTPTFDYSESVHMDIGNKRMPPLLNKVMLEVSNLPADALPHVLAFVRSLQRASDEASSSNRPTQAG